jgi:hypothetical protein
MGYRPIVGVSAKIVDDGPPWRQIHLAIEKTPALKI